MGQTGRMGRIVKKINEAETRILFFKYSFKKTAAGFSYFLRPFLFVLEYFPISSKKSGENQRGLTGTTSIIPFSIALFLNSVEGAYTPLSKQVSA
jgi:hypothetical protein